MKDYRFAVASAIAVSGMFAGAYLNFSALIWATAVIIALIIISLFADIIQLPRTNVVHAGLIGLIAFVALSFLAPAWIIHCFLA